MYEKSKQKDSLLEFLTLKLERFHIHPSCLDECSIGYLFASDDSHMEITNRWHAHNLTYLIVPLNSINQPLYLYIRSVISALHINVRNLISPLVRTTTWWCSQLCSYSHTIRQLEKRYNEKHDSLKLIWNYQLVISVLSLSDHKTG